jgi:hypothetical protein
VMSLQESSAYFHDDLLFCATLLTGFFSLMRLGELTEADNPKLRDPRKVIQRSSVKITENSFSLFLPGHKGDRFFNGNIIIVPRNDYTYDAHSIFIQYLQSQDRKHPLFSPLWLHADGSTPTQSWFTRCLRKHFDSSVSGHSMHAGGATLLAELGSPPHLIQAIGRWRSDAFQAYIHKHPVLIHALVLGRRSV